MPLFMYTCTHENTNSALEAVAQTGTWMWIWGWLTDLGSILPALCIYIYTHTCIVLRSNLQLLTCRNVSSTRLKLQHIEPTYYPFLVCFLFWSLCSPCVIAIFCHWHCHLLSSWICSHSIFNNTVCVCTYSMSSFFPVVCLVYFFC